MIFTNVIKPTHICNLNCSYCYNDDVRDPVMREETLYRTISETFRYVKDNFPSRGIHFIWHGGEPMAAGRKFYEKVREIQKQLSDGLLYSNSIQTNGVLIDDAWIEFFKREKFSISISIDGPKALHDRYRVDYRGRGSFDRVIIAIEKVQRAGLPLGICVVISQSNIDHVDEIYAFLSERNLPFNIIPLNKSGAARNTYDEMGLASDEYAKPWIRMFDLWFEAENNYVYCSDFVFKTRAIAAGKPADCVGLSQCADTNISVDPVGDVFPCATLSGHDDTRYGNINDTSLGEMLANSAALTFRNRKTDHQCQTCKWRHVCHGGCPARSYKFFNNYDARDYYCPSLFQIYEHIEQRLGEKGIPARFKV